ncbi:MAG: AMP-binding protein [Ignavibacteriales bacterium]|nr:AMP-binding protein [Ignavibacteriales bacterium]
MQKSDRLKKRHPFLKTVVMLKGNAAEDWVISFEEFKAMASDHNIKTDVQIKPDSLATLMYTSGTTGEPKGIMFSHTNIVYKRFCRAMAIPGIGDEDRYLAFLPLVSHIWQMAGDDRRNFLGSGILFYGKSIR